ncbi:MAG: right-handed parallel beta-helix repeat-containing protein [Lentisphaeria bacterium]|nr:right-handed parallel beta-helix repeat-containing protein [Lentisphaeria bacterium]
MANVFSVANAQELMEALTSATGGDTIKLASGDYGTLTISPFSGFTGDRNFSAPVTIISENPEEPATFSGFHLQDVSNLTFDNITFDYQYSPDGNSKPFLIRDSSGITIRNSLFDGDNLEGTGTVGDGYPFGTALLVRWSSDITIENNEMRTFLNGAQFMETTDIRFVSNNIHDMRSDGTNFAEVQNVLIEDNYFHDFRTNMATGDHSDMIQFWTTNTDAPSTDVIIRGNTFDAGDGGWTQTIFMRNGAVDSGGAGLEMFWKNILIEENIIVNGHLHGITVGATDGLVIRDNLVLSVPEGAENRHSSPSIRVADNSVNVAIEGNLTAGISGFTNQFDWQVADNVIVQNSNQNAAGYYGDIFLTSTTDDGVNSWALNPSLDPGEFIDLSSFSLNTAPEIVRPAFDVETTAAKDGTFIFDASYTYGPSGQITEDDAKFIWDFGDGTGAIGQKAQHTYKEAGRYEAKLTVILPDGTAFSADAQVALVGDDVLSFDPATGLFYTEGYGNKTFINGSDVASVATDSGQGIDLGGEGTVLRIRRPDIDRFFETDRFTLSMTLSADEPGNSGFVSTLWGAYTLSISNSGNVSVSVSTKSENKSLSTTGVTVNDGALHDIAIEFNSSAGYLRIIVDGVVSAETQITGIMGSVGGNDLSIGAPSWLGPNFEGVLTAFDLDAAASNYRVFNGDMSDVIDETVLTDELPVLAPSDDSAESSPPDAVQTDSEPVANDETKANSDGTITSEPIETDNTPTPAESFPQPTPPDSEPVIEDESSLPEPLLRGGYQLDLASIENSYAISLHDDAHVAETATGPMLIFDGKKDYVSLGRLTEFEQSQKIAFSVTFVSDNIDGGVERLVWNHMKVGLTLEGDGLRVHTSNAEQHFSKGFKIDGLGLNDGNLHNVTMMVDAEMDRLQVVVDDILVLDELSTDFDFVGAGGHEWGWSLGTAWNRWFEGEVHDFKVSNEFDFINMDTEHDIMLA